MKKGIQDLRALAVLEVIYRDSNKEQSSVAPDEVYTVHVVEVCAEHTSSYAIDINDNERRINSASGDYLTLAM